MRERVKWIDTAKFLGIFAIFLGHFGDAAGFGYAFVFRYHVAFFFLLSGCMSNYDKEPFGKFFVKKLKSIMIPFWFFCFLAIVVQVLQNSLGFDSVKTYTLLVLKGAIRNTFFAGALWFLTCLFVMEIVFKLCLKS